MSVAAQKRKKILIAGVSATFALGAFYVAVNKLTATASTPIATTSVPPAAPTSPAGLGGPVGATGQSVSVLTVTGAMKKGVDKFSPQNTVVKSVPAASAPQNYLAPDETKIDGQSPIVDLAAGDVLTAADVQGGQGVTTTTATSQGIKLKSGDVAMSIPFDTTKAAAGYIGAGDSLDVLVSDGKGGVTYGMQGILVIKVGAADGSGSTGSTKTLLVEVSKAQAPTLAALMLPGANGQSQIVQFVLRAAGDN